MERLCKERKKVWCYVLYCIQTVKIFFLSFCIFEQEINFGFGEIGKDAGLKVAESVEKKTKLEKLELNGE